MSSHQGSGNDTPVERVSQLVEHHARGEKPRDQWKIGTEHEKFAFSRALDPLTYEGSIADSKAPGIKQVLEAFRDQFGWHEQIDQGQLIALLSEEGSIALEPGGQVELSGQARATIHETRVELDRHVDELRALTRTLGVRWMWVGAQPVHQPADLGFMPKRRYGVMRDYLPTRGALALHMMQATSTVQANLDFGSERDMGWKLRAAMGVSSIVTAMFANSPFQNGRPSGLKTFRASVWRATDPDRSGLLPFVFEGDLPTYERYARWALDVPMFFVAREGQLVRAHGRTFRDLWERGFEGLPALSSLSDARGRPLSRLTATMEDWELHLSTLFPDVRLKTYLETRTTDCVPPRYIPALPAIWKGILYDQGATEAAWDLVKRWSMDERWQHRDAVLEHALAAPVPGSRGRTVDLAKELLAIARVGLAAQAASAGHADESIYLDPIGELVERGLCPADELLAKWRPGMTNRDLIAALVEPE